MKELRGCCVPGSGRAGPEKAFGAAAVVVTDKGHTGVQNGSFLEKAMPGWRPKR